MNLLLPRLFLIFTILLHCQFAQANQAAEPNLTASADLEADLLKERDRAEFNLNLAKQKLEKNPEALAIAKRKYIEAWRSVNLFIEDIQESIRKGKKPTGSKLFKKRGADAQKALQEFNAHVEKALLPPEKQPKFLPALIPVATTLAESLWNKLSESIKARSAEKQALREEAAKKLDGVKFRAYDEVPK
jgi:hypothetical protein